MTLRIGDSDVDDDERSSSQMMFPVYFYLAHLVRPESLMPQFDSDDSDSDSSVEEQEEEEKEEEKYEEKREENVCTRVQDAHDADEDKITSVTNGGDDDVLESLMADGSFTGTVTVKLCIKTHLKDSPCHRRSHVHEGVCLTRSRD